jgi:RND family efflux transporter MFP subunit
MTPPSWPPFLRNHEGTSMRKRWIVIIALSLAAAGAGWLIYRAVRPRPLGATAIVRRGTIEASLDALGTVQVQHQMNVAALVSGRVRQIDVAVGDYVLSGTLLIELDSPDAQDVLAQAERAVALRWLEWEEALKAPDQASIDLAVARLRRATVVRQRAQQDYDAVKDQPDSENSDEALALEAAKLDYQIAQAEYDRTMRGADSLQMEQLRVSIVDAELSAKRAQERVAQLSVYAPMDGTVMQINTQVGENIYPYNPLMQIADLTSLEVRADINELDIVGVAEGQSAMLWLDAFPGDILWGEVVRVLPAPSTARGMTTYVAIIAFGSGGSYVRPGMGVNVTITTATLEDVLLVPRRAVRTVGMNQVVRVVVGGRASDVVVTTGLSNTSEVQVLSGLGEGQQVLVE